MSLSNVCGCVRAVAQVLTDRTCGCLDFDLTQGNDYEYVFNEMFMMSKLLAGYDDDTKRLVTETLCSGVVNDGDHLQVCPIVTENRCAGANILDNRALDPAHCAAEWAPDGPTLCLLSLCTG